MSRIGLNLWASHRCRQMSTHPLISEFSCQYKVKEAKPSKTAEVLAAQFPEDSRDLRAQLMKICQAKSILDLNACYGQNSIGLLKNGAGESLAIETCREFYQLIEANRELNQVERLTVLHRPSLKQEVQKLREGNLKFDLVFANLRGQLANKRVRGPVGQKKRVIQESTPQLLEHLGVLVKPGGFLALRSLSAVESRHDGWTYVQEALGLSGLSRQVRVVFESGPTFGRPLKATGVDQFHHRNFLLYFSA